MWLTYGLAAMTLLGAMLVLVKRASVLGAATTPLMLWLFVGGTIGTLAHALVTRQPLRLAWAPAGLVALAALLSYAGNLAYLKAVATAPNPGLPVAIEGCKVVVVLVASYFLFDASLSLAKLAGVVLCLVGVYLIAH